MLAVSIIPLTLLGFASLQESNALSSDIALEAEGIGELAIEQSSSALTDLGIELVKTKAEDVAGQVKRYIKDHPEMTVADLQNDPEFQSIIVQPVGETGFTTGMDADSLVIIFHQNPGDVGIDLHSLQESNPNYYKLQQSGWGYIDTSGYYSWTDENGILRDKYGYYVVAEAPTADNVFIRVGSTVYLDEFLAPVMNTNAAIQKRLDEANSKISASTSEMSTANTILIITVLTILVVALVSVLFANSITAPLKRLAEVADKVSMGETDDTDIEIKNDDEIGDLADSFKRMIVSMKYYMEKAKKES